jgi:orotidine-5'-phosphate decarboxylase
MSGQGHFADRLLEAIEQKGAPVCVGIDPDPARLPDQYRAEQGDPAGEVEAVGRWCMELLETVAPHVPAVKPQIARFECLRGPSPFMGMGVYADVVRAAREMGLVVIGDAKRGDIGSTASAYASAHLAGTDSADALTVNGYFVADGLAPFVDACTSTGRGLFVLVRTSNPSGADIQNFSGEEGMFYEHMARQVAAIGSDDRLIGASGYSCIGAVVGATCPEEASALRELMPQQIFLLPGYGAQGAGAEDCAAGFKSDGTGAIVNASRSVIYAYQNEKYAGDDWKKAVEAAAVDFAADIASAVGSG